MAADENEKYRPALHFAPQQGWINDPNGLIRVGGLWHAFYQHDPTSTNHGPMHWGHATSTDLVRWIEQPVALFPDGLGTCFSGCAIQAPEGEIKLFYTAHQQRADGTDCQTQCLVHVDGELTNFARDPGNPVIHNPGLGVFRDPKIFWHAETARWIMVLTHGQSIGIHSSTDLVDWRFESTFGEADGRHSDGPWECPDLFALRAPDGTRLWVLIVGIGSGAYAAGSGTQYFIGRFDGQVFENANSVATELWLDHGRDFYAAQSFFGGDPDAPTILAWASNWAYARETPTRGFRGSFSLPRQVRLLDTRDGLRLAASVPPEVAGAFDHFRLGDTPLVPRTGTYRLTGTIQLAAGQLASIKLFGETSPHVVFERQDNGRVAVHLRRDAAPGMTGFAHNYLVPLAGVDEVDVELFVDNGLVELAMEQGSVWATSLYFPDRPAGRITLDKASIGVARPAIDA